MSERRWITFGNKSLKDFGIYISGNGTYNAPERDRKTVAIPGRNGDLTIDNGRYKNVNVKYPAFIVSDFDVNMEGLRDYLLSITGYARLEDTYHPDEFRMARYNNGLNNVKMVDSLIAGQFDLSFDCKPQRFLKDGERVRYLGEAWNDGNSATIINPTMQNALPLLQISDQGPGTIVTINGVTLTIDHPTSSDVFVDCEAQECYLGNGTNWNSHMTISGDEFPQLIPGENVIGWENRDTSSVSDAKSKLWITPRWWRV